MDYIKEFSSKLLSLDRSKSVATVFKDFLTLSAYALAQPFYRSPEIEKKYEYAISEYTKEQAEEFSQLLALLVSALEEEHQDFLGEVFMQLNLPSPGKSQFFTPYRVSKMMSRLTGYNVKKYNGSDIMTLSEPCCGSGGMIIAFAEAMLESGMNYQHTLYVEATDIDEMCFKMTYIQLSILGIPARVILGDSLSMRYNEVLYTPFYFLGGFKERVEAMRRVDKMREAINIDTGQKEETFEEIPQHQGNQLTLFNFL